MLSANNRITGNQLKKIIILDSLSMGVLFFPRRAALLAGRDGWLIAIGLTFAALFVVWLYSLADKAMGNRGDIFINRLRGNLPVPFAYAIILIFWLKLVVSAGLELRIFSIVTQKILLHNTPSFITAGGMIIICAYGAAKGIETRARAAEVLFPLIIIFLLFFLTAVILDVDFSNLSPALSTTPGKISAGIFRLGYVLAPLECLLLTSRYTSKPENGKKFGAVALAGIILTLLTVAVICKFGARETASMEYPVLMLMDLVRFPGLLIERQDAVMFSFWIIAAFVLLNCHLHYGAALTGKASARRVIFFALCAFGVSLVPLSLPQIELWLDRIYFTAGIFLMFVLPVIILAAGKFKNKKRRVKSALEEADKERRENNRKVYALILPLILLSGCWDGVSVENRAFATVIAIDKAADFDNRFDVSLVFPETASGEEPEIESVSVNYLNETPEKLNAQTDKEIYLGQAKILLLGEELLSDGEMLAEAIGAIDSSPDINRQMLTLTVRGETDGGEPVAVSAADVEMLKKSAPFLVKWFKNKADNERKSFSLDFMTLKSALEEGGDIVVPAARLAEGGTKIGGGVMVTIF